MHILQQYEARILIYVLQQSQDKFSEEKLQRYISRQEIQGTVKQKIGRTTEGQNTEDNQDARWKKPTRTEHGKAPEDTHYPQPEILPHTRPPEKNSTTGGQDTPYEDGDHSQTDTLQNNKQSTKGYARDDVSKVFSGPGAKPGHNRNNIRNTNSGTRHNEDNPDSPPRQGPHTRI